MKLLDILHLVFFFYIFINLLKMLSFVLYSKTEVSLLALVHVLSLFCFYNSSSAYLVFVYDITAQLLSRVVCKA
ncbi:hypothetical protein BDA99DRAFT_529077 [Phascolomyces articulosus]|uniref:Uncharacterized protein n=1 Tax=Phascolomyces articulosus TaxID=60185 RepID=A0AAD5P7C3_9FUNG|nr:hypothetical protein BDA99DRAFT_529077 [Phascolomyces articulosus]